MYIYARCLRYERNNYGKFIRKLYESKKVNVQRKNMRVLLPRNDELTNTLTTVLKDNLLLIYEDKSHVYKERYRKTNP